MRRSPPTPAGSYDVECDIADPASIDGALVQSRTLIGVPAEVTIKAGVGHSGMLIDEPVEEWDRVMAINTRGRWLGSADGLARIGAAPHDPRTSRYR